MNCKLSSEYMMKVFDGDLNDIENGQLKQHLKTCRKCSEEYESMSEIVSSLNETQLIEPPQDFEVKVMERISSMEMVRKKRSERNLAFMYTGVTIILLALWMVFYEVSRYVDIQEALSRFGVFSETLSALFSVIKTLYVFMAGVLEGLFQVVLTITNAYYQTFVLFAGVLLLAYSILTKRVRQTDGGAR